MAEKVKKKEVVGFSEKLMDTLWNLPVNIFIVLTGLLLIEQISYKFRLIYALIIMISGVNGLVDLWEIWGMN